VLLNPDFVEQRIKLIDEYNEARKHIPQPRYSFQEIEYNKWRLSFEHLEYMIYNRMISIGKAVELSSKTFYRLPSSTKPYKRDFIRRVYPKILYLEPSNSDPNCTQREYQTWYNILIAQVESPRFSGCPGKDDLDLYLYIHDNLPEEMGPSDRFILFLQDHAKPGWRSKRPYGLLWYYPPEYFTEQKFLDFITAMSRSTKPLSSFYGRYALLIHEYHLRISQGKAVDDLYNKVELLANNVEKHKFSILGYRGNSFYQEIKSLQQQIGQCLQRNNVGVEESSKRERANQ
jgi:hypothetical protein